MGVEVIVNLIIFCIWFFLEIRFKRLRIYKLIILSTFFIIIPAIIFPSYTIITSIFHYQHFCVNPNGNNITYDDEYYCQGGIVTKITNKNDRGTILQYSEFDISNLANLYTNKYYLTFEESVNNYYYADLYKTEYSGSKSDGNFTEYESKEEGISIKGTLKNNMLDGAFDVYFHDQLAYSGFYTKGIQNGDFIFCGNPFMSSPIISC